MFLLSTSNRFQTFTGVSVIYFEQVDAGWAINLSIYNTYLEHFYNLQFRNIPLLSTWASTVLLVVTQKCFALQF